VTKVSSLTSPRGYFEDFEVGERMRHARGTTIGEVENQMVTKLVMNTADAHYNEHKARQTVFGQRVVFGLVTGSVVIGLATQDTAEQALAELRLDKLRFRAPVYHGDSLTAFRTKVARPMRRLRATALWSALDAARSARRAS